MRPSWVNAAASPARDEAPALERRPHHEREGVVGEERVDVGPVDARLPVQPVLPRSRPPQAVVLLGHAQPGPRPDELLAGHREGQHGGQLDRRGPQVPGPLGRRDQHAGRAVVHQAVVEQAQRLAHVARGLVVLHAERVPHDGGGVAGRPLAEGDRHGGQLLGRGPEAGEVALGGQGGPRPGRGHAHDRVLTVAAAALPGALPVGVAAHGRAPPSPRPPGSGHARERDGGQAGDHVGEAGGHRHRRVLQAGGGEPAVRPGLGVEAQVEAQGEGQRVGVDPARRAEADQQPVEVGRESGRHRPAHPPVRRRPRSMAERPSRRP